MKNRLLLLLFVLLTIPGISAAAELRTLEIEFSFTSPDEPDKQIASRIEVGLVFLCGYIFADFPLENVIRRPVGR